MAEKTQKQEEKIVEEKKQKVSQNALQDGFLNAMRKDSGVVTIHLMNGFQIKGIIRSFDNFTVLVDVMAPNNVKQQQLIFKHAISTITTAPGKFPSKDQSATK